MDRRTFLKVTAANGLTLYLTQEGHALSPTPLDRLSQISPIERSLPDRAPRAYFGDNPDRSHAILWNKDATLKRPLTGEAEHRELVIIGGGISGLISGYLLREYQPVILEQATRFGGNSKGQSWRGIDYAIGAAYICEPEDNSPIAMLLEELDLITTATRKAGEDPVAIGNSIFREFWSGESCKGDALAQRQFSTLRKYFSTVYEGEELPYPEIPIIEEENRSVVTSLDRISFRDHVYSLVQGPLHPQIETALEHYCWSSLGAPFQEISAAAGVNFYAAEFGNLLVYPGGNAAIGERLLTKLHSHLPANSLRTETLVYDVRVSESGVQVRYIDDTESPRLIEAKAAIVACPKFIAAKLIPDLEPERVAAMKKLRYRSYLVGNVLLELPPPEPFYDLYLLGDGRISSPDARTESTRKGVTDVILANFASRGGKDTVLTLYRALPFDGARVDLYAPTSYERVRGEFEREIVSEILPLLKLSPERITDLRIARWGHPLPVATPGIIADGTVDLLRRPFRRRVFFVEQDSWALPAFETAATEAFLQTPLIKAALTPTPKA